MSFLVHELPRARSDKRAILVWLLERSPQGGAAWLRAYDDLLVRLQDDADRYGHAFENDDCSSVEVKQAFFKTRRGRVYRVLYFVEARDVYILRVRGPGQASVAPEDLR